MRVLLVAPNISMRMGGEAVIPYHCMRELRALGLDVKALTHARVRDELRASPLWRDGDFHFVEDAPLERFLYETGKRVPGAVREIIFETGINVVTLARLASRARELARDMRADIIHQPTPVSPRLPSFLTNMPAPVVIGPLNGNMVYPDAFRREFSRGFDALNAVARGVSDAANFFIAGKRRAARILVANERTRKGLPAGVPLNRIEVVVENGVDLSVWTPPQTARAVAPTFVFVGRLVGWKGVDLLIEAFGKIKEDARLLIVGDGEERARLEALAKASNKAASIEFLGFRPAAEIRDILASASALVLPSLRECGGAVILEAFACGAPAIATDWGGPQDYITRDTGFLIAPASRAGYVGGLADAMRRFCDDPALSERMGRAARARVEERFSWRAKAKSLVEIYARALAGD